MLLTRVYSAFIGIMLLVIVMGAPGIYMNAALTFVAIIGLFELYRAFKQSGLKPIEWMGYLTAFIILFSHKIIAINDKMYIFAAVFLLLFIMFASVVLSKNKLSYIDASITLFSIFYIPFMLAFIGFTRNLNLDKGNLFVWLILIGGWATDTMAYFSGKLLGKNKLIPDVSPKKTVEGAIGGIIGCTLIIFVYGLFINSHFGIKIAPMHYIALGLILSVASQLGDLTASSIKRATKIKDFGTVMPGHGGVIDRFDSILLVAPIVYFYLSFIGC